GEPILFGRTHDGKVFGLRDICPHRGVPLSFGTFDGKEITCHFHGWRYSPAGRCMAIPTMVEGQNIDISRIGTRAYEVRDWQGNIWVWMGEPRAQYADLPSLPEFVDTPVRMDFSMEFPCAAEYAIVAFFDPAHTPHVHKSWWYRARTAPHEKEKRYVPIPYGLRMERAVSKANGLAYRMLGGDVSTEISFYLPAWRVEHIKAGKHNLWSVTTVTPIDDKRCRETH